jgi:tetratricopeptide (TPR) repeat protein
MGQNLQSGGTTSQQKAHNSRHYLGQTAKWLFVTLLIVLLSHALDGQQFAGCPAADGTPEDPTYPLRKQAFAADASGDHDLARHLMRCAIRSNPHDLVALKQQVYLDLNAGDKRGAVEDIDALRAQGAGSPQFEAQEGYIYAGEKKYADARAAFGRAIDGGDPVIAVQSWRAIRVLDGEYPRHVVAVYTDNQYLNRFSDGISDTSVRYLERLGAHAPFQVYANARLLRDSASNGGTLPQIFSDNAFLGGAGLQFQPRAAHYVVSAELNGAYVFYGSKTGAGAFKPDIRTVAGYFNAWRPALNSRLSNRWSLEANGSVGYYSRYQGDTIAYLQPRLTYDLTRAGSLRLTPFFQQSLTLDANRQFYNNTVELIPGFEASTTAVPGLAFRAEYVRGFYLPVGDTTNPYPSSYSDFRFRLLFQRQFHPGGGPR